MSWGYVIAVSAVISLVLIFAVPLVRDWTARRRELRRISRFARSLVAPAVVDIATRCEAERGRIGQSPSRVRLPSADGRHRSRFGELHRD